MYKPINEIPEKELVVENVVSGFDLYKVSPEDDYDRWLLACGSLNAFVAEWDHDLVADPFWEMSSEQINDSLIALSEMDKHLESGNNLSRQLLLAPPVGVMLMDASRLAGYNQDAHGDHIYWFTHRLATAIANAKIKKVAESDDAVWTPLKGALEIGTVSFSDPSEAREYSLIFNGQRVTCYTKDGRLEFVLPMSVSLCTLAGPGLEMARLVIFDLEGRPI